MSIRAKKTILKDKNNNYIIPFIQDGMELLQREQLIASRLYKNAEITDAEAYSEVLKMKKSSFDISKIQVIGNPVITSDGVASGFSGSNYINTGVTFNPTGAWKIKGKINTGSLTSVGAILSTIDRKIYLQTTTEQKIGIILSSTGSSWDIGSLYINVNPNTDYYYFIEFTGNKYIFGVSEDNVNYTKNEKTSSVSVYSSNSTLIMGSRANADVFDGSIDLAQFSITIDGQEVYTPLQTGMDVLKPNDYIVVGNSVVTDDGILQSGGAIEVTAPLNGKQNYSIELSYQWDIGVTDYGYLIANKTNWQNGFCVLIENGRRIIFRYYNGETDNQILIVSDLDEKEKTYVKVIRNGNTFTVIVKQKERTITRDIPFSQFNDWNADGLIYIGTRLSSTQREYIDGVIDLNSLKIYIDGNLVYQPCLRIPYTESKTGAKIVDIQYKDRLEQLYSQYGTNNYFVIDEKNKAIILPYDSLRGEPCVIKSYRNGTESFEYNTNLECIETGYCIAEEHVTLLKPMADENYIISVPYSEKTKTGFTPTVSGDWIAKGRIYLE